MRGRSWSRREWLSRLLAGAAVGCSLLLAADMLVIFPLWGPRLTLSDPRREMMFFIASSALPASIAAGALGGLVWRRTRTLQLSRGGMVGCCLAVAFVSQLLRPVVARVHRGGRGPLYEVIPDNLAIAFCILALIVLVWPVQMRNSERES